MADTILEGRLLCGNCGDPEDFHREGRCIGDGCECTAFVAAPETEADSSATLAAPEPEGDFPRHVGGGYYDLSNGERVQGKEEAEERQTALDAAAGEQGAPDGG